MNDDKHVDFAALKYYDERNKQYIDTKVNAINSELKDVERRVDSLEATANGHTEQLTAHREELDDLEARVITLERDDVSIRKDIADLRVAIETNGSGTGTGVSKEYVDNRIEEAIESLNIPDTSDFVTKSDFADATEDFVTESQITELTNTVAGNQVAIEELQESIDAIKIPDVSNLVTKSELEEAINSIEHPTVDLEGYATEEWVNAQGFIKEHQDLSDYAKKSDLPSVEGLASESYVDEKIAEINIPDTSTFVTNEEFTSVQQQVENIQNTYVTNETLEHKNYLTIQDAADTYVTNDKVTEVVTNEVETVMAEQIETKVTEIIEQKIEGGEINVNADAINYDTWD